MRFASTLLVVFLVVSSGCALKSESGDAAKSTVATNASLHDSYRADALLERAKAGLRTLRGKSGPQPTAPTSEVTGEEIRLRVHREALESRSFWRLVLAVLYPGSQNETSLRDHETLSYFLDHPLQRTDEGTPVEGLISVLPPFHWKSATDDGQSPYVEVSTSEGLVPDTDEYKKLIPSDVVEADKEELVDYFEQISGEPDFAGIALTGNLKGGGFIKLSLTHRSEYFSPVFTVKSPRFYDVSKAYYNAMKSSLLVRDIIDEELYHSWEALEAAWWNTPPVWSTQYETWDEYRASGIPSRTTEARPLVASAVMAYQRYGYGNDKLEAYLDHLRWTAKVRLILSYLVPSQALGDSAPSSWRGVVTLKCLRVLEEQLSAGNNLTWTHEGEARSADIRSLSRAELWEFVEYIIRSYALSPEQEEQRVALLERFDGMAPEDVMDALATEEVHEDIAFFFRESARAYREVFAGEHDPAQRIGPSDYPAQLRDSDETAYHLADFIHGSYLAIARTEQLPDLQAAIIEHRARVFDAVERASLAIREAGPSGGSDNDPLAVRM